MDRVKFGRALGYGARHAAKTLRQAVDAASAPNPDAAHPAERPVRPGAATHTQPIEDRPQTPPQRLPDVQTLKAASRQAKSSLVAPVVRFSSVVSLQVSGIFFALVALIMCNAAWRSRAGFHAPPGSHPAIKLYACIGVAVLFAYFTISSFVRAARR